jgi:hypothetical protein
LARPEHSCLPVPQSARGRGYVLDSARGLTRAPAPHTQGHRMKLGAHRYWTTVFSGQRTDPQVNPANAGLAPMQAKAGCSRVHDHLAQLDSASTRDVAVRGAPRTPGGCQAFASAFLRSHPKEVRRLTGTARVPRFRKGISEHAR